MKLFWNDTKKYILPGILHSYSIVFFAKNKILGTILLLVTFFIPIAGLSGLISIIIALLFAIGMGFSKDTVFNGLYGFNALMVGLGLGSLYQFDLLFLVVLVFAALLTFLITIVITDFLGKSNLPFLSLPFVLTFWLLSLATKQFDFLQISERNIYWMNEFTSVGGLTFFKAYNAVETMEFPMQLKGYFISLSAIFFQENLISGIIIAAGILYFSRIAFSLTILSYCSAIVFFIITGTSSEGLNYYHLGANYMLTSIAIGGFFIIPSGWSFLWAILLTPIITFFLVGSNEFLNNFHLAPYSLPFSLVVIFFIAFLRNRNTSNYLQLVFNQQYSPELNLYKFKNNTSRLKNIGYFNISFPFYGEWMVTQGYDGNITHKGDWAKALDFMLIDEELKTFTTPGVYVENYYTYNKPVLAPADGVVEEIVDFIEDNSVGRANIENNWGNTIVIRHANGLYTKMSHLKLHSFKVVIGEPVTKGQWIANMGNSGRSPEPHLHFQVQFTPYIGSKTASYPFSYYILRNNNNYVLRSYEVPNEGELVSNVFQSQLLIDAFRFTPGLICRYEYNLGNGQSIVETFESATDAYNNQYLFCKETGGVAYFVNDGTLFYFTEYIGNKSDLLFCFYKSAYKVLLAYYSNLKLEDQFPLSLTNSKLSMTIQDFIAPFILYLNSNYVLNYSSINDYYNPSEIVLEGANYEGFKTNKKLVSEFKLVISKGVISSLSYKTDKTEIFAKWIN